MGSCCGEGIVTRRATPIVAALCLIALIGGILALSLGSIALGGVAAWLVTGAVIGFVMNTIMSRRT